MFPFRVEKLCIASDASRAGAVAKSLHQQGVSIPTSRRATSTQAIKPLSLSLMPLTLKNWGGGERGKNGRGGTLLAFSPFSLSIFMHGVSPMTRVGVLTKKRSASMDVFVLLKVVTYIMF